MHIFQKVFFTSWKQFNEALDATNIEAVDREYNDYSPFFFVECTFKNIDFSDDMLHNMKCDSCAFKDCSFRDMEYSEFHKCNFEHVSFDDGFIDICDFSHSSIGCKSTMHGTVVTNSNFSFVNFYNTEMCEAKFDIRCSLAYARLENARCDDFVDLCTNILPSEGDIIGWKKVIAKDPSAKFSYSTYIVKLLIPEDAMRSCATGRKCRCEFAKVLDITEFGFNTPVDSVISNQYVATEYKVGEMVYPDSFDENRYLECTNGIHFFITREEAIEYAL